MSVYPRQHQLHEYFIESFRFRFDFFASSFFPSPIYDIIDLD